jgi:hypothetical protein
MSAWGRPFARDLGAALGANYLYRAFAAALLAMPVVVAFAGSGIGKFAEGDAKLFEPGALYLLEVLLHERETLAAAASPILLASLAFALASLVPESLLLAAVWRRARAAAAPLGLRRALPHLVVVGMATWLARLTLVIATLALGMTLRSYAASAVDERWPLLVTSAVVALGLLGQAALSVLRDLAMLGVVGRGSPTSAAVGFALRLLRRRALRLVGGYGATALVSAALFLGALAAGSALDASRGLTVLAALLVHQLAVAGSIALRATWLCAARRSVEAEPAAASRSKPGSGRSVLVDLEVAAGGRLPAQIEAQEPPGEPGPGGVPEGREPPRDGAE